MASKRIPLNQPQTGLNAAFSGLELSGLPAGPPETPEPPAPARRPGRVVLRRETAHRGGKTVTVVDAFEPQHTEAELAALALRLRTACGAGGTLRGRAIEVQGDKVSRLRELLESEGFRVAGER